MRDIKFRAWDGVKMLPAVDLSAPLTSYNWLGKGDYPLMQYTGLKDKNGVEIYEGDILHGLWGEQRKEDKKDIVGFVEFRNGSFQWSTWLKSFHGFDGKHGVRWVEKFNSYDEFREVIDIQVIGNIHENPELLEAS